MRYLVALFFLSAFIVCGQPVISPGGVFNAGSAAPDGLGNSGIAQGSIFIVVGTGLGTPNPNSWNPLQKAVYPLPTSQGLNGTTIQLVQTQALGYGAVPVTQQGTVNAIMLYESATMLAAILPSSTPTGVETVTVTYNGVSSLPSTVHVVLTAPGLFNLLTVGGAPGYGYGPGYVFQLDSSGNATVNSFATPATPGQTILLFGTGLGAVTGDESQGPPPNSGAIPGLVAWGVYVGGQPVTSNPAVDAAIRVPGYAGVDAIQVQVPQNVQGCFVSIAVPANSEVSNTVTMAVSADGSPCSDSAIGYSASDLAAASGQPTVTFGTVSVSSGVTIPSLEPFYEGDGANASFISLPNVLAVALPTMNVSSGGCIVLTGNANAPPALQYLPNPQAVTGMPVDAGSAFNLTGPDGPITIAEASGFTYPTVNNSNNVPMVGAGSYSLNNGGGGASVGAFQGNFTVPPAPTFTNADALLNIEGAITTANNTVTWTGGDPNSVVQIFGFSADANTGLGASFYCNAPPGANTFTVPGYIVSWLPNTNTSIGYLGVANVGHQPFQAPGVTIGYFTYTIGSIIVVQWSSGGGGVKELRMKRR